MFKVCVNSHFGKSWIYSKANDHLFSEISPLVKVSLCFGPLAASKCAVCFAMSGLCRVSQHAILVNEGERLANVDSAPDRWVRRKFFQRDEFSEPGVRGPRLRCGSLPADRSRTEVQCSSDRGYDPIRVVIGPRDG